LTLSCAATTTGAASNGTLSPPLGQTTITIVYTPATGSPITHTVTTDATGNYTDQITLTTIGLWQAQAHWTGNTTYLPATSAPCSFIVRIRHP